MCFRCTWLKTLAKLWEYRGKPFPYGLIFLCASLILVSQFTVALEGGEFNMRDTGTARTCHRVLWNQQILITFSLQIFIRTDCCSLFQQRFTYTSMHTPQDNWQDILRFQALTAQCMLMCNVVQCNCWVCIFMNQHYQSIFSPHHGWYSFGWNIHFALVFPCTNHWNPWWKLPAELCQLHQCFHQVPQRKRTFWASSILPIARSIHAVCQQSKVACMQPYPYIWDQAHYIKVHLS